LSILDILRKHNVSDECLAEVKPLLRVIEARRAIDTKEANRVGIEKLKIYLKRDAARMMGMSLAQDLVERETMDAEGNTTEIVYTLTVAKEKA
jgi:hypothetical protein